MPRVSVVFPAALSPAMASIVGRGPRARCIRIIFSGTCRSLPALYESSRYAKNPRWLLAAHLHRSLADPEGLHSRVGIA
jgi:hypothetical protein